MKVIKIDIYYIGDFRKSRICPNEEDYTQFMKWYGFDPDNKKIVAKRKSDGLEFEYFYPETLMSGKEDDDKNLVIKMIIVNKNWEM